MPLLPCASSLLDGYRCAAASARRWSGAEGTSWTRSPSVDAIACHVLEFAPRLENLFSLRDSAGIIGEANKLGGHTIDEGFCERQTGFQLLFWWRVDL
jgi:hypothetical protein